MTKDFKTWLRKWEKPSIIQKLSDNQLVEYIGTIKFILI